MEPVVYDFAINERGTWAELLTGDDSLMPPGYYMLTVPTLLRTEQRSLSAFRRAELDRFGVASRNDPRLGGMVQALFDRLLPSSESQSSEEQSLAALLDRYGFDRVQHEQIRADMRSGRIGLAQNRLPVSSRIEDVTADDVVDLRHQLDSPHDAQGAISGDGCAACWHGGGGDAGRGRGSRWTQGAGGQGVASLCAVGGVASYFWRGQREGRRHVDGARSGS